MRKRHRDGRRLGEISRSYEAAGDIAMSRFSYVEATAHFERALRDGCVPEDEIRLCDKITDALLRGARPDLATEWVERTIVKWAGDELLREKLLRLLQGLPHQRWLNSETIEAFESSLRARRAANDLGDAAAVRACSVSAAGWLMRLGRYNEARHYFECDNSRSDGDQSLERKIYVQIQRANIQAAQGRAMVAFAEFDRALDLAKELPDGYVATLVWDDYANWSTALGRLDIARGCRERALLVARERRVIWRIPYLTLRFAAMLIIMGNYEGARDLVLDALTYDVSTPVIYVLLSTVGSEIASILGDESLLKRTMNTDALELAFKSGEPERIAPITVAYAKIRIKLGQYRSAKTLIARGVEAINQADFAGDLLALAARYGSAANSQRAYSLIQERIKRPHHRVAHAYLKLWEAYDAQRRRAGTEVGERAYEAARLFARLGRKRQESEALALAGVANSNGNPGKPLASHLGPALTPREQQVAELILRGLTNRAIAKTLQISEHTVETHVTSILNRLGLRSRWQLADHTHI